MSGQHNIEFCFFSNHWLIVRKYGWHKFKMAQKLLFPSSSIFNDADEIDCIHQCDIDLRTRSIPCEEIESLLSNILDFLETPITENYQFDVLSLVYDCFSVYPNELINLFEKFRERSFKTIMNFNASVFASISLSNHGVSILPDFVQESLSTFRENINSEKIVLNGLEFTEKESLFAIHHLLRVFPVTTEILTPFIPKLFVKNPTDFRLDLVAHIAASNLLVLIPEKYYITLDAYVNSPSPSLVFTCLVPFIPKSSFFKIAPSLETYLISLGYPAMSLVFLKKCYETDFKDFKDFQSLFNTIDVKNLDQNILDFTDNFEFTFSDKQAENLTNFDNSTFFLKTLPEPQKYLSDQQIEAFFESCEDPNILRRVLKPLFSHPLLMKAENWAKFIKLADPKDFATIGKCFVTNAIDIGDSTINLLLYVNLDNKVCDFLRLSLNMDHRDLFLASPRLNELLSTIHFQPSFSFWRLFSKSRCLISYVVAQNFRCPYVMYGLVTATSFTKLDPFFQTIYIEPQTPESLKKVEDYCNKTCINKTALFTSINGGPAELSLMAAGHYYGTRIAYHQARTQIEGIDVSNILHFSVVASMTYKVTCKLHASPVFMEIYSDPVRYSLTCEALKTASKDLKLNYFDHILTAMPTLYLFNTFTSKLRPIVLDVFKSKEYDEKQMVMFLNHLSNSTASPTVTLRRSLIKDPSFISVATNEPTKATLTAVREEEHAFWSEIAEEAFDLLSNYDYQNDYPLNFHCDCIKHTNIVCDRLYNHPTAPLVKFIQDIAISTPKFEIDDPHLIYDVLEEQVQKENWPVCESIIHFLCKIEKTDGLQKYFDRNVPLLNLALTHVFKPNCNASMFSAISVDFVIGVMTSKVRLLDTKVRVFLTRVLNDDDTLLQYYIRSLKQIQRGFCVMTQTIAAMYWDEVCRDPEIIGKAIHSVYASPVDQPSILIARPKVLENNPPSKFAIEIMQKMMENAFEEDKTRILCWATYLVQSHGFLLEGFDHIKSFEKMMGVLSNFGHSKNEGTFRASLTTLALLYNYISIPSIADTFFEWFFAFRNEFNANQIYAFLLILRAFLSVDAVKTVMAAVLVRYDFLSFVPSQCNAIQYSIVTELFMSALDKAIGPDFYTFDAISCCNSPFVTAFDDSPILQRYLMQSNPLNFILSQLSEDDQAFVTTIIRDRFFKRESEVADGRTLEKILSKYPHDENVFIPEWASKVAFDNLPEVKISTILHHRVPKLPTEITPTMQRYLATKPNWVSAWIKNPSTLLLLPIHYKFIYETIEEIQKIEKKELQIDFHRISRHDFPLPVIQPNDIELDFTKARNRLPRTQFVIPPAEKEEFVPTLLELNENEKESFIPFNLTNHEKIENNNIYVEIQTRIPGEMIQDTFLSNQLFESLVSIASFGDLSPEFSKLLVTIGNRPAALNSILSHVNNNLCGISNGRLISIARILAGLSKCSTFSSSFDFNLSKPFQKTICSPQFRLSTVLFNVVSSIFGNLSSSLPDRSIQVIKQMLLSGGNSFTAALVPYSKLGSDQKKGLQSSIEVACDLSLNSSIEREVDTVDLMAYLNAVPEFMTNKKPKLLIILNKLLERYDPNNNQVINRLFNIVQPKSEEMAFTTRQEGSDVPQEVKERNPEFWQTVIKNSSILCKLISNDRSLINGPLAFLKTFPSLLDFPLRLSLFNTSGKAKLSNRAITIKVHRDNIIQDSYQKISLISRDTFLGEININFIGENGVDLGGLRKDWYTSLIRALFNPEYALFTKERAPNPSSNVNPEHLLYFFFTGKMIARAILDNVNVDCHLPTVLCKEILGVKTTLRDLEALDPELFRSFQWMLNNDVTDLDMRYTAGVDILGVHKEIPLIDDGENVVVTNENKEKFVELTVRHILVGQTREQTDAFVKGFHSLITKSELRMFSPSELDLIICGIPTVDVRDMRKFCKYEYPFKQDHPVVQRFFAVIRHWNREDLAKLLLFVTGSSQVPIGGFKTFMDEGSPFTLAPGGDHTRLPAAHTCTNTLDLPDYRSEKEMNEKLLFSVNECNSFGFQ
ncbi:hypothetical protein TRFO_27360 [Tritrichomonas foetus]|uniref:HECT-type E3 ubiquitin transferase n=1 Tax=Tritrichomonas foetus TaxID=1144522 RepID=A0A1J4K2G5_9EUKA|nr:hypothetical protein TRFO_27360 [Tritrichomonas foetus]|eukprot:OHT04984.1 hypothetical protein TRFO_27360 [Tritrichomonas foetus]